MNNSFVFSWDMFGIESIIASNDYEHIDHENTLRILKGEKPVVNPLGSTINSILIRARANPQRHYEVYAVKCDKTLDKKFWERQWKEFPQATADLIREKGIKLYSDRMADKDSIKIV